MTTPPTDPRAPLFHRLREHRLFLPNPTFGNTEAWEEARPRILLARLSPFSDVQRSSTHLVLFREARSVFPGAFIDMAFLPGRTDADALAAEGYPPFFGAQSLRPAGDFDLLLVSNSWLLEQANLPWLLTRSGIPLWARDRGEEWPLLLLGGSSASAAHALVDGSRDCMADAVFFGEGEGSVGRIMRILWDLRSLPKQERVARAVSEVPGLWQAGTSPTEVRRARAPRGTWEAETVPGPVLPGPEAATARLAITQGCPCLCSFCFEAFDRRPFRETAAEDLLRSARLLKTFTGASTLEVESFNFNTHAGIAVLLEALNRLFLRVNLMSQRVDVLAGSPGLLDLELAADKTSFTLGVEGISERVRSFLHKSLAEEEVRRVLESVHARRAREIKLFYLLTGREDARDLDEFALFVKWLKGIRQRARAAPRVVFSFGYLVRMPFTPLRHDPPLLDEEAWREPTGRAKSICETNGFEFRLGMRWPEYAATQALALGGSDLHRLLQEIAREEPVTDRPLTAAASAAVRDWIDGHRGELEGEKPRGHPFGFPFLDTERVKAFLHRQFERAKELRDDGYCRHGAPGPSICASCTGCTRNPKTPTVRSESFSDAARSLDELMDRKHRLRPLHFRARLPRDAAGLGTEWAGSFFLRELLRASPGQADNVLSVTEAFAEATGLLGRDLPWHGETVVAVLAWDRESLLAAARAPGSPLGPEISGFDAESLRSARVSLFLPAEVFKDPAGRLSVYLRDAHAPVTMKRTGRALRLVPGEKSLKKRMLLEGLVSETPTGVRLDLTVGRRPFIGEWLATSSQPSAARAARAEIVEIS